MKIILSGVVIIVGGYGSGKTEVSINLAIEKKQEGLEVQVADLDIVNPYFRTREAKDLLSGQGIDIILPPDKYLQADLPIVSPAVSGMIRRSYGLTLIDCGGNDAGATVLASLADSLHEQEIQTLQVINMFRPDTSSINGCMAIREEIELASKLRITGIIGNTNLVDKTEAEHIYHGYDFIKNVSDKSGLPVVFVTVPSELVPEVNVNYFDCPILTIYRKLMMPWNNEPQ